MAFKLNINLDSFTLNRLITGQIWFDVEKEAFPDNRWVDFPVIILGWWLENLKPLVFAKETLCECRFMDGPYLFKVLIEDDLNWQITFIESRLSENICATVTNINHKDFLQMLLKLTKDVVAFCEKQKWESKDVDILSELLNFYKELEI